MFSSTLFVRSVLRELDRRGVPTTPLVEEAEIDRHILDDVGGRLPRAAVDRLAWRASEVTSDPSLGVSIGVNAASNSLQLLGFLLAACRTLRDALNYFNRYAPVLETGSRLHLETHGDYARITRESRPNEGPAALVLTEALFAAASRFVRQLGPQTRLSEVWLARPQPDDLEVYRKVFSCPIRFSSSLDALLLPHHLLDHRQVHADDYMVTLMSGLMDKLVRRYRARESEAESVRFLLSCRADLVNANLGEIARELKLSPRSLRRVLADERTSLRQLLNEARRQAAVEQLGKPDASVKEVAALLGYSGPSALHRAFVRWTGTTPVRFKRQMAPGLSGVDDIQQDFVQPNA